MHLETTTSANPKEKTESKRTSKNFNESNFGTKSGIYDKLRSSINNSKGDSVKKIMQNWASNLQFQNRSTEDDHLDRLNCSTQTDRTPVNKLQFQVNKKTVSPFKFYNRMSKYSPVNPSRGRKDVGSKKGSPSKGSSKGRSQVMSPNSSIGIKKENQIYSRSLEEFVESNINCINDLIEYKQLTNHTIVRLNASWKSERNEVTFQQKRQSQLKSEISNLMSNSALAQKQNEDMRDKILKIREKINSKEQEYVVTLGEVEEVLTKKKNRVSRIFAEIQGIKETTFYREKDIKHEVKTLEWGILDAEKQICRLNENINISKQYEAHRLQILRDKQKILGDVICKDSYVHF